MNAITNNVKVALVYAASALVLLVAGCDRETATTAPVPAPASSTTAGEDGTVGPGMHGDQTRGRGMQKGPDGQPPVDHKGMSPADPAMKDMPHQ